MALRYTGGGISIPGRFSIGGEMLEQALAQLAVVGGAAVVQAAGTDAWTGLRQAMAGWFGLGDGSRTEQAELERLDRTAAALQATGDTEQERIRQEASWQARIEARLENLQSAERDEAADQLRALLARLAVPGVGSLGLSELTTGGNVDIRADHGSIAAGVVHGGAHVGNPSVPDPSQG
ncbi:hypothetical protein ABZ921_10815 [Streptomyces atriruber]|uniref:WXG100 family type VII secretion target n=1 Tax=Streptomyces atriruber TaxID=545121 RepID=A0ABV3BJE5_9ACTN